MTDAEIAAVLAGAASRLSPVAGDPRVPVFPDRPADAGLIDAAGCHAGPPHSERSESAADAGGPAPATAPAAAPAEAGAPFP